MPRRYPTLYRFYCDISGTIKGGNITIGTVLFNESFRPSFINQFYDEFPKLRSFNRKATTLNQDRLEDVISFIDSKGIKMTCIPLSANTMYTQKGFVNDEIRRITGREPKPLKDFHEKVLSVIYYYSLRDRAIKKYIYDGQVCIESQIKIERVLSRLCQLSRRDGYSFNISFNHRRNQHLLKFADFVASAGRRLNKGFLNSLENFNLLNCCLDKKDISYVFNLSKIEYEFKRIRERRRL